MNPGPIDFYFDFSSPYSYIASEWIEALAARHGRTVNWKAILLGATFQAAELKSPVSHPLKREYSMHDFERSARFAGVPLKMPEKFPIPTQNAARVFWWLQQHASQPLEAASGAAGRDGGPRPAGADAHAGDLSASHWARHCLRAYFARGVDLSDPAALQTLAAEFGLDAGQAAAVWNDPQWKARLKAANDAAIALGVFGAPFFMIDGEPFWGNDRRAQIERWLEKGPF
ncbi:MAG: 2-hydroxychromene-2-carboxylate isomerase [Caldimonas sp.]